MKQREEKGEEKGGKKNEDGGKGDKGTGKGEERPRAKERGGEGGSE